MKGIAFSLQAATNYPRPQWSGRPDLTRECVPLFDWVKETGFDGIEISENWISLADATKLSPGIADLAAERGLAISSINCWRRSMDSPHRRMKNQDDIFAWIELANTIGCKMISLSLSTPPAPGSFPVFGMVHSDGGSRTAAAEDYDLTASALRPLADVAASHGISLTIELHHCSIADNSSALLRLLREIGRPNVGANPDLVNLYWAYATPEESWRDALVALSSVTNHWHVKNVQRIPVVPNESSSFSERPLNQGDLDFRWCHAQLFNAGFHGWTVVESAGFADPFALHAENLRYLRALQNDDLARRLLPPNTMPRWQAFPRPCGSSKAVFRISRLWARAKSHSTRH